MLFSSLWWLAIKTNKQKSLKEKTGSASLFLDVKAREEKKKCVDIFDRQSPLRVFCMCVFLFPSPSCCLNMNGGSVGSPN